MDIYEDDLMSGRTDEPESEKHFPERRIKINVEISAEMVTEEWAIHCDTMEEEDVDGEENWIVTHVPTGLAFAKRILSRTKAAWLAQSNSVLFEGLNLQHPSVKNLGTAWAREWIDVYANCSLLHEPEMLCNAREAWAQNRSLSDLQSLFQGTRVMKEARNADPA